MKTPRFTSAQHGAPCDPRRDTGIALHETVLFFPTCAALTPVDAGRPAFWEVPIHGWIYQPTELKRLRRTAFAWLKRLARLRFPGVDFSTPLFKARLQAFLSDNQRNNHLHVEIGGACYPLKKSRADGHFDGTLRLPIQNTGDAAQWLTFRALTRPEDDRLFEGQSQLLPPTGLSVISDIDDTIKITEVLNRRTLMRNTFLREFQSVPEMAALYRGWAKTRGAAFHYVSASPWHLYPFLAEFLRAQDFPAGSMHLRTFRLMPRHLPATLQPPHVPKLRHARALLCRYPGRRFILVGDSGEHDARIYARLARDFPQQVESILIRNITGEPAAHRRWAVAFRHLPRTQWQIFAHPAEIQ